MDPSGTCKGKVLLYSWPIVGPGLIPVYSQSSRRWLFKSSLAVGCHYFPLGLRHLPSWRTSPVPSYTTWWQRQTCPRLLRSFVQVGIESQIQRLTATPRATLIGLHCLICCCAVYLCCFHVDLTALFCREIEMSILSHLCRWQLRLSTRRGWTTTICEKFIARFKYWNCSIIPTSSSYIRSLQFTLKKTRVYRDKTAAVRIMQFSEACSPMPYLFACQVWWQNSKGPLDLGA